MAERAEAPFRVMHSLNVHIDRADAEDAPQLAELLWLHASAEEQERQPPLALAADLETWMSDHVDTHLAFVARAPDGALVGMAWLALVPRVPRPGATTARISGDIQSLFVLPEHRGKGIGSALVQAAVEHAHGAGAGRVTVQSGRRSVPLYERLGFAPSRRLLQTPAD